jgi:photosystem II stability/assembly factor-like uncharacterized protein
MRQSGLIAAVVLAAFAAPAAAQPQPAFEDAAIHAVQFIDPREGWAAGDDGVVWHSIDGGKTWERQKTGTRASLRSVHFLTPYTGWAVGRQELPNGAGSIGVMLRTSDGGIEWQEVGVNVLPGLHVVRFFDEKNGLVCGDGSDAFPSGMFTTTDGGKTWRPVSGPRQPGWRAADFGSVGIVAGAWGTLGRLHDGTFVEAELDPIGGRTIHAVKVGEVSFAVGDGGMVLASTDRKKWGFVNLGLSRDVLASCDFRCVAIRGPHVWVAGRPGSFVLHSSDAGKTWEIQKTNLACPINGMTFLDEKTGWLVGELGTIAGTTDGGKTWTVQRIGGQRAAVLCLHAHGKSTPLDLVAMLGHGEGYFCAAVGVMSADPSTADPKQASDSARLRKAVRLAGGVSGETIWSFALGARNAGLPPRELMASWAQQHDGKANEHLLRQAVLAIRMWRPEVVVTDVAAAGADPAEVLVLHAAKEAFKQAGDPNAFPEQITELGIKPWEAKKLYALSPNDPAAPVKLDLAEFSPALASSPKDYAEPALRILDTDTAAAGRRCFKLIAHRLEGAEKHTSLMEGIVLARGGEARRRESADETDPEALETLKKAAQTRRHLEGLAAAPDGGLAGFEKVLAMLGVEIKRMPADIAARTTYAVGMQLVKTGKWAEAREVFGLLVEHHPGHPLAIEAYRWLLRYHASSEARRRVEIQQKLSFGFVTLDPAPGAGSQTVPAGGTNRPTLIANAAEDVYRLYDDSMIVKWHQACLDFEPRLAAFGPVYSRDPAAWLSLLAARRQVGRHNDAEVFIRDYFKNTPGAAAALPGADPWRDCLAAELWLSDRGAIPHQPKPLAQCRFSETRPFLDGKLDEDCWQKVKPMTLNAVGETGKGGAEKGFAERYKTEARFAYDGQFIYIAVSCSHPEGEKVAPEPKRARDADLGGSDRVEILLDMDRDYQTYYRLQVDHRGRLAEDCWGDRSWNPKYFVAFNPTDTGWTAEYAIPVFELTGDRPSTGRTWAVNVSRVVPGQGMQAWSAPAGTEPRPEGMGLLQFRADK